VTLTLDQRALAYFDDARTAWVADAGDFELLLGTRSVDLPHTRRVRLTHEWIHPINAGAVKRLRVTNPVHH
jgi:beta-glucosidase